MEKFSFEVCLAFDEESGHVYAELTPEVIPELMTRQHLQALMDAAGYAQFYVLQDNVDALLNADRELCEQFWQTVQDREGGDHEVSDVQAAESHGAVSESHGSVSDIRPQDVQELLGDDLPRFLIAQRLDAVVEVSTSEDATEAYIAILPPYGGKAADAQSIETVLQKKGVSYGLLPDAVESAVAAQSSQPRLVAQGVAPTKGQDSRFKALVSSRITTNPRIDDKGKANYLDINDFVLVEPGTALMQRLAPKPGTPGVDVYGKPVPAPTGDLLPFDANISGSGVSSEDKNLLVATIKGHPILHSRGVSVDPALVLTNVSLATGNVEFDGSVHVKEDVADGMTIKATGEVVVNGVVGKATILAEGDVVIDQGLIGGIPSDTDTGPASFGARIESKGSVTARFVTCARILSEGDIRVREYISHSELDSKDKVLVGQGGGKGNLFGGSVRAKHGVVANILGTKGSVITDIRVGADADTLPRLRRVMQQIRERETYIIDVQEKLQVISSRTRLSGLNPQNQAIVKKLVDSMTVPQREVNELRKEEKRLQGLLMKSKAARVIAKRKIYQNVNVQILHTGRKVHEDTGPGTFRFDARQTILEK